MNTRIKITRKQAEPILAHSFPNYQGRKITLEFTDKVSFYDTNWSGGTCNQYAAVRADGASRKIYAPAPWVNPIEGKTIPLPEDVIMVEHSHFCGVDSGIHIYANPIHAPRLLEEGAK